jgi:hypothetical protein
MTAGELTLGAVLARLGEREREIAAEAQDTRERIAELTFRLKEFDRAAEEVRITRKTLLGLPDPPDPAPPTADLPDHPATQHRQQRPVEAQTAGQARNPGRNHRTAISLPKPTEPPRSH